MSIEIEKAGEEPASSNAFVGQGAIQLPPYEGNYEIDPKLFDWVRKKPFKGEPEENPFHHIWNLMDLFGTMQTHPTVMEIIKCKIFTHSLDGKALRWLQCLPHASLNSWDEVRDIFLDRFFTKSMTTSFRDKISNFRQEKGEEFHEAWFRLLGYTIDCPHHGFSEAQVLIGFYDGLEMEQQLFLDTASNGDFSRNDPDAATQIIENLANRSRDRVIPDEKASAIPLRSGRKTEDPVAKTQESKESRPPKAQTDECRPTASTVSIDTQANVDRHLSQPGETKPEDDEWSEDESLDDESSDGEVDEEEIKDLLLDAYRKYYDISPESVVQVIDPDNTLVQTELVTLGDMIMVRETSTSNDDPTALEGEDQHFAKECRSTPTIAVDRHPSEHYALQPTEWVKQSENDVFTDEELHRLILEGVEEEKNVRKMGAQPCIGVEELEIPLPESIGMYDKLIKNLKSNMLCSEESRVKTPDFIKDVYNILDESEKSASLRAENLPTRFDEIKSGMNNLYYITEDRISTFEESTCLSKEIYLENDLNVDKILEEVENSKVKVESEIENTTFYEVKGDEIEYLIDPPKPEIDFVFSPDLFYPHMHQPHLERFRIELENVASAYYNCLLAVLWNFVCLVVCLFACNDRRRTKGALAQPFDSCD